MLRKWTTLVVLVSILAAGAYAQGLNTSANKDDWEEINFEYNTATLSDGYPSLLRLADLLQKHQGYHVKLEGNTDNLGTAKYNEKLGLDRATAVRDFLVKYGAKPSQIDVATRGKSDPRYSGYKNRYSQTDVARWMNRRVVITVADEQGKTVSDGGVGQAITALGNGPNPSCCEDILKRLDKLDDILRMLKDLADQNANLRKEVDDLKNKQSQLEAKGNQPPQPTVQPATPEEIKKVVDTEVPKAIAASKQPRFSLLGVNVGEDNNKNVTFTGRARYFAPFDEHFAIQAQGEYLYFKNQQEGQFDLGIVDRIGRMQASLFGSFKHVELKDAGGGGNLGQAAFTLDYLFSRGRIGLFGTKAFLDGGVLSTNNLQFVSGTNLDGTPIYSLAPNIFIQNYLRIVDQAGASTSVGLWGRNYLEANLGYLRSYAHADRPGGTVRFVFPFKEHFAFTIEGGINETLLGANNSSRAVVGVQWGNFLRPQQYLDSNAPVPVDVPRIRYEVLTRTVHKGATPPIADAGPDQIGVPAGTISLNGSGSRDPNNEPLVYQWVQEIGPTVTINNATSSIASFVAAAGQTYGFRLTVRNTDGLSASARTTVTTVAAANAQILFFIADPTTIQVGQSSTLSYRVVNATSVTINPGPGTVNASNGSISVSPNATTTYTLTAKNATSQDTATVTVNVQNPQPLVLSCTASPMTITQGQSSTISYQTQNATTVTITPGFGNVAQNGSVVVTPTTTTAYTVTASNSTSSATSTCGVTVQVTSGAAPQIVRFTASPQTIQQGGTSTLVWQVNNATTVTISPTVGSVGEVGTQDVQLTQTTTYTITGTNSFGSASANVTVNVTTPPPPPVAPTITSFTANPAQSPSSGSPVVLTCLANNANQVVISGVGAVNSSGQLTVTPQATITYVCVAVGPTGLQASANLTVPVGNGGGGGGGTPPVVVITTSSGNCGGNVGNGGKIVCQVNTRDVTLNYAASSSPSGNNPLSFLTTSINTSASVINPTSPTPSVQLGPGTGDYLFQVIVTDSKGNQSTATVDLLLIQTGNP